MGQHGAHLGPVGPRWAPCWPYEPCYQGLSYSSRTLCLGRVDVQNGWNITLRGFLPAIVINYCNMTHVGAHTVTRLQGLLFLDLSHNHITYLDPNSLSGLNELIQLDMSYNLIEVLPENVFDDLNNLDSLYLSGNNIVSLESFIFSNLLSLVRVELRENDLYNISEHALGIHPSRFTNLLNVDFSKNRLHGFPLWLLKTSYLTDINLEYNDISFEGVQLLLSKMSETGFRTPNLDGSSRTISLYYNNFAHFDITLLSWDEILQFQKLSSYVRLDFGEVFHCDCRMYQLYACLHDNIHCSLNVTLISQLHESLDEKIFFNNRDSFECLTPIETKGMSLLDVPVTTFGCYEDVIGCPRHCRCWLRSWDKAVRVECMNRNLTQLPAALPDRTYILNYSRNLLTGLTDLPGYFEAIQILDLSQNSITKINWDLVGKLPHLTILQLHDNGISTLPKAVSTVVNYVVVSWDNNSCKFSFDGILNRFVSVSVFAR